MGMNRLVAWIAACSILALPAFSPAAEMGHEGMAGKPGEMIFSGKAGPWAVEARLIDKKAHMEKSGVSAKIAARFAGERHLMIFLTDPATGKPVSGAAGEVVVKGPDNASSSKVTLVVMGDHIGVDVVLSKPGEYSFTADIESGGRKGSATFSHTLK